MQRDGVLKNIFKADNWDQISNAKDFMYTRKAHDKYSIDREDSKENKSEEAPKSEATKEASEKVAAHTDEAPKSNVDTSKISSDLAKLKAEKDLEVSQLISKINDLITRQNRLESTIEELQNNLKELTHQVTLYVKKPAPETQTVEKREPLDKPIDRNNVAPSDVTIEKMFNFSNKKF